jgi:hypothetical protein
VKNGGRKEDKEGKLKCNSGDIEEQNEEGAKLN